MILYSIVGLVVWPNGRPGGLLGVRGTRIAWATLWLLCAYLWLLQASSGANAIRDMIDAAPSDATSSDATRWRCARATPRC